jgi:hypothetical protein
MSNEMTITRSEDGSKGRYEARVEGRDGVGELTFSRMSPTKIIADHTAVDDSLRGTLSSGSLRMPAVKASPSCLFVPLSDPNTSAIPSGQT